MPIIIDTNRACDFNQPFQGQARLILNSIANGRTRIGVGGELLRELLKTKIRTLLLEFDRAGVLKYADNASIEEEKAIVLSTGLRSNDEEILAVARVVRARILYTEDNALMDDFRDLRIINPKGKILTCSTPEHRTDILLRNYGW
jgi:predicted nucleic acid-binding protein